jgi:hypothetical protein
VLDKLHRDEQIKQQQDQAQRQRQEEEVGYWVWVLFYAWRPQTPKHIRSGWSHYTDTSDPVDVNGAQNIVTV